MWEEAVGINSHGDIVGVHYDATWNPVAVSWITQDGEAADRLPFPGTWSVAFKVSDNGIAAGAYGGDTVAEDVAVVHLH